MKRKGNGARRARRERVEKVAKYRRVPALLKYLKAYGIGEEGSRARAHLAKRAGTKATYLVHIAYGFRCASAPMALAIEAATHGVVTRADLRPDINWGAFAPRATQAPATAAAA